VSYDDLILVVAWLLAGLRPKGPYGRNGVKPRFLQIRLSGG
jgi:hypothetical protein